MIQMMHMMDEYLLDPSNLVMEMDYFYENGDGLYFIYIPGYQADFWTQMEKLSEVCLNYVDYGDERAVLWAYAFYEKVHGDMCSVETLDEITQMEKTIMNKTSVSYIAEDGGSMDHKDHLKKDKATFWQYIRKKMKCRTEKYSKKEKEVSVMLFTYGIGSIFPSIGKIIGSALIISIIILAIEILIAVLIIRAICKYMAKKNAEEVRLAKEKQKKDNLLDICKSVLYDMDESERKKFTDEIDEIEKM